MVLLISKNLYLVFVELLLCKVLFESCTNALQLKKGIDNERLIVGYNNKKLDKKKEKNMSLIEKQEVKGISLIEKKVDRGVSMKETGDKGKSLVEEREMDSEKEIDASSKILLISRRKPVKQSTNFSDDLFLAEVAVDGDVNNDSTRLPGCAQTSPGKNYPWFMVDLEEEARINHVKIYNRMDCCSDQLHKFTVYVSDSDKPEDFVNPSFQCQPEYKGNLKDIPMYNVSCNNKKGRYVILYINDVASTLNVCELQVYGTFVDKCQNGTHNCKPDERCTNEPKRGGFKCLPNNGLFYHIGIIN